MARTPIADNIANIAGAVADRPIWFKSVEVRDNAAETAIISRYPESATPDAAGHFTISLEPGLCIVTIGTDTRTVEVPVSVSPIRLGPLWEAGGAVPAASIPLAIINGGGVEIIKWITQAEWSAIAPGAVNTTYIVKP